jgi:hypothetical protein
MARKLREDLEEFLTEDDAALLGLAGEIRAQLRERGLEVKGCLHCRRDHLDVWNAALDGVVKKLVREGKRGEAKERILHLLFAPSGQPVPDLS